MHPCDIDLQTCATIWRQEVEKDVTHQCKYCGLVKNQDFRGRYKLK